MNIEDKIENEINKMILMIKPKTKYTIFVSSTYEDLKDERQAIVGSLLTKGFIPVGMEQFHAAPTSQWEVITSMIDECDYYLLIIGGCYGSIDDESGLSYTEKEYRYAKNHNVPVIAFLPTNPGNITKNKMDTEDTEKKQELLTKFKCTVKKDGNTVGFYEGIEGLKSEVLSSLDNLTRFEPRLGWIRYDSIKSIVREVLRDFSALGTIETNNKGEFLIMRNVVTAEAGDVLRIPESGIDNRISNASNCVIQLICDTVNDRPVKYRSFKVYEGYVEMVIAEDVSDIELGVTVKYY